MLDVFVPRARQEFDSIEAAHQFYLHYAKMAGFSVRTMRTRKRLNTGFATIRVL
jgi:hypothetical protein